MTKLTFNIIHNATNRILARDFSTYLLAKARAEEIGGCRVETVYHSARCDAQPTSSKHRLVARA